MRMRQADSTLAAAWDVAALRRLGRACSDLAVAELTQGDGGPVRHPEFLARTQALLRVRGGARQAPQWLRQLAGASLHLSHPCAMAQQISAPLPLAALVESLVSALNQSIAVWEMSPAGTLVDRQVMEQFKALLGLPAEADGTLTPGGSFANLTALLAARAALAPRAWKEGSGGAKIAILAGAHSHYSVKRAAAMLGLGADCVFPIRLDAGFRADPAAIPAAARRARAAGFRKFILVATSGSTPTGSFDDLEAFARAARRLGAWLHLDAAHGGGMAFSRRLRPLLRGLAQADSLAFDPHKMMFMPLSAGAVLLRRGGDLRGAFEQDAPYLFSPVRREVADVGPFTLACSQRFEALKIWLVWKAYGPRLFAAAAEAACQSAQAGYEYCLASKKLAPLHRPESNIFCFRLRAAPAGTRGDRMHWDVKEAVNASGRGYISSTVLNGRRCLRLVVMNPRTRPEHVERVLKLAGRLADKLGQA
jgi:L-2,4-diaminobutyrate decarboxylase